MRVGSGCLFSGNSRFKECRFAIAFTVGKWKCNTNGLLGWKPPLEQRQSIQAFQRNEEPKILEFRRRLAEAGGGGAWEARIFGSEINEETDQSSGHEQPAWELVGQDVAGPYVPVPEVEKIGRELLSETYPEYQLGSDKGGVRQLSWSDPVNGGFLYVTVHEGKATLMRYQTGLRPSDGTTANPRDFISGRVDIDIPEK